MARDAAFAAIASAAQSELLHTNSQATRVLLQTALSVARIAQERTYKENQQLTIYSVSAAICYLERYDIDNITAPITRKNGTVYQSPLTKPLCQVTVEPSIIPSHTPRNHFVVRLISPRETKRSLLLLHNWFECVFNCTRGGTWCHALWY